MMMLRVILICLMDENDMAIVLYNPAPFKRSEVVPLELEIPLEWKCDGFEI